MASNFTGGLFQAVGAAGLAVPGGLLYTYAAGMTTPLATYTNQGGGSSNANPVVCDVAGQAQVWLGTSSYRMILKTAAGVTVWDIDNISGPTAISDLSSVSSALLGSGLVGYSASLAYAAGTIGARLRQRVSVTDHPYSASTAASATANTTAFTAAQAAATYVYVPDGVYQVNPGLNYWQFYGPGEVWESGQQWEVNPYPQTGSALKAYRPRTFGNLEDSVGASVSINSTEAQRRANTQVQGTTTQSTAQNGAYDHVGQYTQAYSYEPDATSAATTYSSTSLTDANVGTYNATAGRIRPGMFVQTQHATPYGGRVQSVAGNVITVDGWWLFGTGVAGTPANGTGALINPNDKVWGMNINVFASGAAGNNHARKGTGIELGISCDASLGTNVWGFDAVTLGGTPENHFLSRGAAVNGFKALTGKTYGFVSDTNSTGYESRDATAYDYSTMRTSVRKWSVGGGALTHDYVAVQGAPATAAIATDVAFVIASGTGQTYTLPTPVGNVGRRYTIRSLNSNTLATAAGLIDASSTKAMSANTTYSVVSDNANWLSF